MSEDEKKFEIDGDIEDDEEYTEIDENGSTGLVVALVIFVLLFLVSTGLLAYFQFYQGNGDWEFSFKKHDVNMTQYNALQEQNEKLTNRVDSLETELTATASASNYENTGTEQSYEQSESNTTGTVFEVQIGAFQNFDPSAYDQSVTRNMQFNYEDGMVKLTIGKFGNVDAAKQFRKDIVRMGVNDAFIVKKTDGTRQGIIEP